MSIISRRDRSWWPRWAGYVAGWVVVWLILMGGRATRGGSIVLSGEGAKGLGTTAGSSDNSRPGVGELEQAAQSFRRAEYETCLKQLGEVVRSHPELCPAHALFAELAFLNHRESLIRPSLERAAVEDPGHPEVFTLFGDLALLEGRLTDASVHFEKARALASSGRWTAERRRGFERLCFEGDVAVAEGRGDWKAARAVLDRWLKLEPADARTRQRLGKALFLVGQYEQAYSELHQAAEQDRTLEPAAITMGRLFTEAGHLKKAEEWMDYAIKIAPSSLAVRQGVVAWLLEQGRADEATGHAEIALKLDPKSVEIKGLLGLAARERKDFRKAEQIFQAMAVESPGDAWLRDQLALVLAEQPDEARMRKSLELAELNVRQNPELPYARMTLGIVYYRLKRLEDAEKVLRTLFESGQGSSDAAYILARVRADRGHPDEVPALLKTALAAPGLFIHRNDAHQWLDRLASASKSGS